MLAHYGYKDPGINLVTANLKGLPPTIIITAEIDPLQSDGMLLAEISFFYFIDETVIEMIKNGNKNTSYCVIKVFLGLY